MRMKPLTIFSPPVPDSKQEVKAISPAAGAILDAVGKVAAALLDGGSDIANLAESAISDLSSTALAAASSLVPSRIQDANSQVDQATGVVGGIVSAATDIVGSLLAGTGVSGVTSMPGGERNTSTGMNVTAVLSRTASGLNRSSTSSMPFNITSAPVLQQVPLTSTTTACASIPPCTACPAPKTETCTVTETWHSTHYESTATLFSFVAAFTYTCTETVRYVIFFTDYGFDRILIPEVFVRSRVSIHSHHRLPQVTQRHLQISLLARMDFWQNAHKTVPQHRPYSVQPHPVLVILQAQVYIQKRHPLHTLVQMQDTLAQNVQMACFALQHKHQLKTVSAVMVGHVVIALKDGFAYLVLSLVLVMELSVLLLRF